MRRDPGGGSAVLVPEGSPIASVAALRGKKIAFTKGSSSHNFIVQVLKKAGIAYTEVTPVYLSPADAAAAFARGSVDAWTIWDPFFALAERNPQAKPIVRIEGIVDSHSFYLANGTFAKSSSDASSRRRSTNSPRPAGGRKRTPTISRRILAEVTAVDIEAQRVAAARAKYAVAPLTSEAIANQQLIADEFYRLGLIPKQISVRDAAWTAPAGAEGMMAVVLRRDNLSGLAPWLVPVAIIVGWQVAASTGLASTRFMPAPSGVVAAGVRLAASGELFTHIGTSFARAASGFIVGGGIGFALGLANGLSALSERLTDTTLQMVRNVPHLALIPLVILWFGIEEEAKLFLVALGVFFPVYVNTLHGIRSVDPQLVEMGRIYGMSALDPVSAGHPAGRAPVDLRRRSATRSASCG